MSRRPRKLALATAAAAAGAIALCILTRPRAEWVREHPLTGAAEVVTVGDGAVTLADGRTFVPAGIRWRETVTPEQRHAALSIATAQGAVIERDLGDGRALATVEPRFYRCCRICRSRGGPGVYAQAPLSEILIYMNYAQPDTDQPGLTAHEQWRLEGARQIRLRPDGHARRIIETQGAFEYDSGETMFHRYDFVVEVAWKPPPGG